MGIEMGRVCGLQRCMKFNLLRLEVRIVYKTENAIAEERRREERRERYREGEIETERERRVERKKERMGGWAIAVHGGAGVDPNLPLERQEEAKQLLNRCLLLGISALRSSLPAIDVIELVVCFFSLYITHFSFHDPFL